MPMIILIRTGGVGLITLSKENVVDYVKSRLDFFNPDGDIKVSAIGEGTVEEIIQLSNSVRLHIRFADDEVKKIDQKWLLRSGHK